MFSNIVQGPDEVMVETVAAGSSSDPIHPFQVPTSPRARPSAPLSLGPILDFTSDLLSGGQADEQRLDYEV